MKALLLFLALAAPAFSGTVSDKDLETAVAQMNERKPGSDAPPLKASEMSKWEKARWAEVKGDAAKAKSFTATRRYVRDCKAIVAGKKKASELRSPKEYDKQHLEKGDSAVIDKAIGLSLAELGAN